MTGVNVDILNDIISTLDLNAEARDIRQGMFHTGKIMGIAKELHIVEKIPREGDLTEEEGINEHQYHHVD